MDTRKESFVFYRSFLSPMKQLPGDEALKLLWAIADFGLDQKEPTGLEGMTAACFDLIRPVLGTNFKHWKNGSNGGRPKNNQWFPGKITNGSAGGETSGSQKSKPYVDVDEDVDISRDKSLSPDYANASAGEHALISGKNSKSGLELLSESEPQTSKARKTSAPETDAAFNEFWDAYPLRNGRKLDKSRTQILFGRLPARARAEVLTAVRNYAASGQMAKDPARFLRDDYWREWLIPAAAPQEAAGLDPAETEWRAMQAARSESYPTPKQEPYPGEEKPCPL
jgi:hypothetical protein